MKKILLLTCFGVLVSTGYTATSVSPATQAQHSGQIQSQTMPDFSYAFESVKDSCVSILSTTASSNKMGDFEDGGEFGSIIPFDDLFKDFFKNYGEKIKRPQKALGSGFIIKVTDDDVFIVSNYHVVKNSQKIMVTFHDNSELPATMQGFDERVDLCVLKVSLKKSEKEYKAVAFGESNDLKVGQVLMAIGFPFGLGLTATFGPVSCVKRDISLGKGVDLGSGYIQHQAAINIGNSGGPLFDISGKCVGVNTAIISMTGGNVGIGFAIPGNIVQKTCAQIIEFGKTKRGYLGITIQPMDKKLLDAYKVSSKDKKYVIVNGLAEGGNGAKAGLQVGDIITHCGSVELTDLNKLPNLVADSEIGKEVELKVLRNGKEMTLKVLVGEYEQTPDVIGAEVKDKTKDGKDAKKIEAFGLTITPVIPSYKKKFNIPDDQEGALVSKTDTQKEIDILPGDLLKSITIVFTEQDQRKEIIVELKNLEAVSSAIKTIQEKKSTAVSVRIQRIIGDKPVDLYLALETGSFATEKTEQKTSAEEASKTNDKDKQTNPQQNVKVQ